MVKRVRVEGFNYGMITRWGLYSMTFEDIELAGQREAGFLNDAHNASIHRLFSNNTVPAVKVEPHTAFGLVTLTDSELRGGAAEAAAIDSAGEILVRNVFTEGYGTAIRNRANEICDASVCGYSSSTVFGPEGTVHALDAGIVPQTTPELPWNNDFTQWASVTDYEHLKDGDNWAPAIQAAIDSGKPVVYFPNKTHGDYASSGTIRIRGDVERIVGLSGTLHGADVVFENDHLVVVEQLRDADIAIKGQAPVVITGSTGMHVVTDPASSDLFLEDFLGTLEVHGSNVWVRQLNEESRRPVKLINQGGQLWVLNLKTEQGGQILQNTHGARTEILGGVIYPVQGTVNAPMYVNDASDLAVFHREVGPAYPHFILEDGVLRDPDFEFGVRYVSRAPEPASLATLATMLTLLFRRRRRPGSSR
jgi:hypothetical protein